MATRTNTMNVMPSLSTTAIDRALDSTKDDSLMYFVADKIVEKCDKEGLDDSERQTKFNKFSKYLELKKDWLTIKTNQELDEDEKLKELLIKWIISKNKDAKTSKLIEILKLMKWDDIAEDFKTQLSS